MPVQYPRHIPRTLVASVRSLHRPIRRRRPRPFPPPTSRRVEIVPLGSHRRDLVRSSETELLHLSSIGQSSSVTSSRTGQRCSEGNSRSRPLKRRDLWGSISWRGIAALSALSRGASSRISVSCQTQPCAFAGVGRESDPRKVIGSFKKQCSLGNQTGSPRQKSNSASKATRG